MSVIQILHRQFAQRVVKSLRIRARKISDQIGLHEELAKILNTVLLFEPIEVIHHESKFIVVEPCELLTHSACGSVVHFIDQ